MGLCAVGCTAIRVWIAAEPDKSTGFLSTVAIRYLYKFPNNNVGPQGKVVAMCSATNVVKLNYIGADDVVDYAAQNSTDCILKKCTESAHSTEH